MTIATLDRSRAREASPSSGLSRARARRPPPKPHDVLCDDVLSALRRRPATLSQTALDVHSRKVAVAAVLRELEQLGLATYRPGPEQGWQLTEKGRGDADGANGTREHPEARPPPLPVAPSA